MFSKKKTMQKSIKLYRRKLIWNDKPQKKDLENQQSFLNSLKKEKKEKDYFFLFNLCIDLSTLGTPTEDTFSIVLLFSFFR